MLTDLTHTAASAEELEALVRTVQHALVDRYGVAVLREHTDSVAVLSGKPLQLARDAARAAGLRDDLVSELDTATLPWHEVPGNGLSLWRQFGEQRELVTQLLHEDPPFQQLAARDRWLLVRALDGATGWTPQQSFTSTQLPQTVGVEQVDPLRLADEAEQFLDVPYLWGGNTPEGIDCSGLVQRAAYRASGCWLPRHSTHLLRVGRRVARADARAGDLLVLKRTQPRQLEPGEVPHAMHVAIVSRDRAMALHASREEHRVIREPVDALLARYRVLSVRRLGPA